MIKKLIVLSVSLVLTLAFFGCASETTTIQLLEQSPTVDSGYLVENPQDGTILHAWNWSMSTVEEHLEDIAIAGFSAVQVSPMQPQKDYFGIASWGSTWWKLYQPLGFSIATEEHSIGTKDDLESLCTAADAYGIKIIVDVVANHLAGDDSQTLNASVADYEPIIYNQNLIHTDNGMASDTSIFSVTRGALGSFPDLMTENAYVQSRVLDLLK
ncbi:MAG TPA: alpha-amylase family glycosyl hydrolase, partial [Bacillota bacterium]|nr:alpha-amylase family glycosyl hydrolase [Bacillota bacterium]